MNRAIQVLWLSYRARVGHADQQRVGQADALDVGIMSSVLQRRRLGSKSPEAQVDEEPVLLLLEDDELFLMNML